MGTRSREGRSAPRRIFQASRAKKFPLVHELRDINSVFSSAFPDFWHEVFGHVPFLWSTPLSDFYQELGRRAESTADEMELEYITKLYWFICEYGLLKENGELKMIGAGLIASPVGSFKLKKGAVQIRALKREALEREPLEREPLNPYKYQDTLFAIESLESLDQL